MKTSDLYVKVEDMNGNISFKPYNYEELTICGKKLKEIIDILNAYDLEKQYDLELTMENLKKWQEILQEDFNRQLYNIKIPEIIERINEGD